MVFFLSLLFLSSLIIFWGVYLFPISDLVSFLNLRIYVFQQIWDVFSHHFFKKLFFSAALFLIWDSDRPFIIPQIPETLSFFPFSHFFLCCSHWIIPTVLSYDSLFPLLSAFFYWTHPVNFEFHSLCFLSSSFQIISLCIIFFLWGVYVSICFKCICNCLKKYFYALKYLSNNSNILIIWHQCLLTVFSHTSWDFPILNFGLSRTYFENYVMRCWALLRKMFTFFFEQVKIKLQVTMCLLWAGALMSLKQSNPW